MLLGTPISETVLLFLPAYAFSWLRFTQPPTILPASLLSQGQLPEKSDILLLALNAEMPTPPAVQLWVAVPQQLGPVCGAIAGSGS